MKKILIALVSVIVLALQASGAGANVNVVLAITLPDICKSNMVLQQQSDAKLWGWATPGNTIKVTTSWNNKTYSTKVGTDSLWTVFVATPKASYNPYTVSYSEVNKGGKVVSSAKAEDVLIGEVWFCSGQSNMEMPLDGFWNCPVEGANEAIANSGKYTKAIRVATVPKTAAMTPQKTCVSPWKICNPENAPRFSAAGYFFATTLNDVLDVPIGIINCSYGGSAVEGWLPKEVLEIYPDGLTPMDDTEYHRKMVMYNAMLHPLIGYTIKGFLWDQGESNVGKEKEYIDRFCTMTRLWRKQWAEASLSSKLSSLSSPLPMYTVELPPYSYGDVNGSSAALFRNAQHTIAHTLENCGCICTSDLAYPWEKEQVHGSQKKKIGERLAYLALTRDYHVKGIAAEAPEFECREGNRLFFTNSREGFDHLSDIQGFEAQGKDGKWHKATVTASSVWYGPNPTPEETAKRDGSFLILSCPEAGEIKNIRYNQKNFIIGNLHNVRGLPVVPFTTESQNVSVADGKFVRDGKPYSYVGTNFRYGAILGSEGRGGNRAQLCKELDLMKSVGIDNVRILVGSDGEEGVLTKVQPTLQKAPGVYNDTILAGLDYLLMEMGKRHMVAVLYLNNSWEWSGGYGYYLEQSGCGKVPRPNEAGYPAFMKFVEQFATNGKAHQLFYQYIRDIVSRTNRYTGKAYKDDPAIMSWQIGNEPRAFSKEALPAFEKWLREASALIKSLDPNHLVSIGSEGAWGCEMDYDAYEKICSDPNIDYCNIHIWPYNWGWTGEDVFKNTLDYINKHYAISQKLHKPLVMEEFGCPRDDMKYAIGTATTLRDKYYHFMFEQVGKSLNGTNFWAWGGYAQPQHEQWLPGDDYCGDPAQEAQGLNSVFAKDKSTLTIIKDANSRLNK